MFYPESALVKRTPGIATVWLMATLGAKQNFKRVSKQAILQVNIQQACDAIHNPQAPMALRLQSNLLYGISRVYSQKCVYILSDAEAAQAALKNLFRLIQTSELDPRAGKARPETLIVPDDPSFLPDIHFHVIDFDASAFDSSGASFLGSYDASGISNASSQSNRSLYDSNPPQLDLPVSDSFSGGLSFNLPEYGASPLQHRMGLVAEDSSLLQDLGFEFDASGNIIDHDMLDDVPQAAVLPDHGDLRHDVPEMADEQQHLNTSEPDTLHHQPFDDGFISVDDTGIQFQESIEQERSNFDNLSTEISNTSEYVEAPQTRHKRTKTSVLARDGVLQILNSELQQWNNDYVSNMRDAVKLKEYRQHSRHAKANAALLLRGIGQFNSVYSGYIIADPLLRLGELLLQQLTGSPAGIEAARKKRKRQDVLSEDDDSDSGTRRTRIYTNVEAENPRGEMDNEEGFTALADDLDPSIELAREAMTMMEDQSTQLPLPWSGSRAGSVHSARLSRQASILSARGPGNTAAIRAGSAHSFDRRTSRLPSVSPMIGHGSIHPSIEQFRGSQIGLSDDGFLPGFGSGLDTSPQNRGANTQEFELFGPAAGVSTQEAAESQWLRDTLNKESTEFLAWIQNSVDAKASNGHEEMEDNQVSIKFDELLPINKHSRAVAAQGFLHVLVLANRGVIQVKQDIKDEDGKDLWWASLELSIVDGVQEDI